MSQEYLDFSCIKLTTHYTPNDCVCITVICFLMHGKIAEVYASRMMLLLAPVSASTLSRYFSLLIMRIVLSDWLLGEMILLN
jgi:hypothetical protein